MQVLWVESLAALRLHAERRVDPEARIRQAQEWGIFMREDRVAFLALTMAARQKYGRR